MGNGQHCLVGKTFAYGLLEELVCLLVHTCRGLIDTQDLEHVERVGKGREEEGEPWLLPKGAPGPTSWASPASLQLPTSSSKRKTNLVPRNLSPTHFLTLTTPCRLLRS